ncbi:gluconokinase [Limnohabitans sp.]|uniref:gluconokinase n=1 Tax=Limnohabitans sp. TaxID=1907725 RepID=UPI00286F3B6A|nr:gluconokinase [Limnohabitans sp.]
MNVPVVIMGVAGCGKSSFAAALSQALGWPLIEGDEFHPIANVNKMRAGIALTDEDRAGWLAVLADELVRSGACAVLTCSALKKAYRDRLRQSVPTLRFVHLELTREQSIARVTLRPGHYFQPALVDSQFAALEKPVNEAGVLRVDATQSIETIQAQVCAWMTNQECV